jgi:hypothetical protein
MKRLTLILLLLASAAQSQVLYRNVFRVSESYLPTNQNGSYKIACASGDRLMITVVPGYVEVEYNGAVASYQIKQVEGNILEFFYSKSDGSVCTQKLIINSDHAIFKYKDGHMTVFHNKRECGILIRKSKLTQK